MSTSQEFKEAQEAIQSMEALMRKAGVEGDPLLEPVKGAFEVAIEYARVERTKYLAEVGKRDGNYVYHFWPKYLDLLPTFGDKLGDVMLAVFKYSERIASKHDEVMRCFEGEERAQPGDILCRFWGTPTDFPNNACPNCGSKMVQLTQSSWAVRVTGYADNPLADDLAASVFDALDRVL
jgi:hypothetical protein